MRAWGRILSLKPARLPFSVGALAVGLLGACSDDCRCKGGAGDASGSTENDSGGRTITLTGQVHEFALVDSTIKDAGAALPVPIPGVEVCVMDHPDVPCATTDAAGAYKLPGVPAASEVGLVFSHDTHFDVVALLTTTEADGVLSENLPADALSKAFSDIVKATYPSSTLGAVGFFAFTPTGVVDDAGVALNAPLDGVKVTLTPSSGIGPIYTTPQQLPDQSLTETQVGSSLGFFANVDPGKYELTFTHATKTDCTVTRGWPTATSSKVRFVVLPGDLSDVEVVCK